MGKKRHLKQGGLNRKRVEEMKNNREMISFKKYKKHILIGGKESKDIANELSIKLGITIVKEVEITRFPDTEFAVKVPIELKGKDVIYIKSTAYPQAENVMELFFTIDTMVRIGVKKIILVMPFFGFGRQDKEFEKGQCISVSTISKIICFLGQGHIENIFTIDAHFHREPGEYDFTELFSRKEEKELKK